jgi:hypothetical protein
MRFARVKITRLRLNVRMCVTRQADSVLLRQALYEVVLIAINKQLDVEHFAFNKSLITGVDPKQCET